MKIYQSKQLHPIILIIQIQSLSLKFRTHNRVFEHNDIKYKTYILKVKPRRLKMFWEIKEGQRTLWRFPRGALMLMVMRTGPWRMTEPLIGEFDWRWFEDGQAQMRWGKDWEKSCNKSWYGYFKRVKNKTVGRRLRGIVIKFHPRLIKIQCIVVRYLLEREM